MGGLASRRGQRQTKRRAARRAARRNSPSTSARSGCARRWRARCSPTCSTSSRRSTLCARHGGKGASSQAGAASAPDRTARSPCSAGSGRRGRARALRGADLARSRRGSADMRLARRRTFQPGPLRHALPSTAASRASRRSSIFIATDTRPPAAPTAGSHRADAGTGPRRRRDPAADLPRGSARGTRHHRRRSLRCPCRTGEHGRLATRCGAAFHTLKGSGRMVGLTELGEAAWEVEQVMNRWLDAEAPRLTELLELTRGGHGSSPTGSHSCAPGESPSDRSAARSAVPRRSRPVTVGHRARRRFLLKEAAQHVATLEEQCKRWRANRPAMLRPSSCARRIRSQHLAHRGLRAGRRPRRARSSSGCPLRRPTVEDGRRAAR